MSNRIEELAALFNEATARIESLTTLLAEAQDVVRLFAGKEEITLHDFRACRAFLAKLDRAFAAEHSIKLG